jgi:hypothetical protein
VVDEVDAIEILLGSTVANEEPEISTHVAPYIKKRPSRFDLIDNEGIVWQMRDCRGEKETHSCAGPGLYSPRFLTLRCMLIAEAPNL